MIDLTVEMDPNDVARLNKLLRVIGSGFSGSAGSDTNIAGMLKHRVGPYLRTRVRSRFAAAGDDADGRGKPLLWVTARKYRMDNGRPINVRTGNLKAFTQSFDIRHGDRQADLIMPSRRAGSAEDERKLRHAQQGGVSDWGNPFPARPVVALARRDQDVIERHTVNWIDDVLRELA